VHIDPLPNFSAHCEKQINKGNIILGLIRRSYSYLDETSLAKLYTLLVRPHLEYANSVSASVYKETVCYWKTCREGPSLMELSYED
jgi:hypothetical protein